MLEVKDECFGWKTTEGPCEGRRPGEFDRDGGLLIVLRRDKKGPWAYAPAGRPDSRGTQRLWNARRDRTVAVRLAGGRDRSELVRARAGLSTVRGAVFNSTSLRGRSEPIRWEPALMPNPCRQGTSTILPARGVWCSSN